MQNTWLYVHFRNQSIKSLDVKLNEKITKNICATCRGGAGRSFSLLYNGSCYSVIIVTSDFLPATPLSLFLGSWQRRLSNCDHVTVGTLAVTTRSSPNYHYCKFQLNEWLLTKDHLLYF